MKVFRPGTDVSYLIHGGSTVDFERMDSTACYGNLADFAKNAILIQRPAVQEQSPTVANTRRSPQHTTEADDAAQTSY